MGGSWSTIGGSHDIAWFTEVDRAESVDRIKAAVVRVREQRGAPPVPIWRTLRSLVTAVWRIVLWKVMPRRSVRRMQKRLLRQNANDWSGSVGSDGPEQVRYSRERAVVCVGGQEFALPGDDRTLLVLIDARSAAGDPIVETHFVPAPSVPREQLDRGTDRKLYLERRRAQHLRARTTWHRWLDEQPLIRGFLQRLGK